MEQNVEEKWQNDNQKEQIVEQTISKEENGHGGDGQHHHDAHSEQELEDGDAPVAPMFFHGNGTHIHDGLFKGK
jgi:hypothetical protein